MGLVIEVQSLIFRGQAKFNKSSGNLAHLKLHNLLKIDISNVIHNPFDLNMININT